MVKISDIVNVLAEKHNMSRALVTPLVKDVFETISDELVAGNDVDIHKFGKFKSVPRPARTARNPKTGESIDVPARSTAKFSFSASLQDRVKGV